MGHFGKLTVQAQADQEAEGIQTRRGNKGVARGTQASRAGATAADTFARPLISQHHLPHSCLRRPGATPVWHHLPSSTHRWWLLLWGVLQACPTQGSMLLAQPLPQKLTSPGYPEPYVKGRESFTDIEAPEGFAVKLIFQDFDLEPSPDCEQDSVTVSWAGSWRDSGEGVSQPEAQGQWEVTRP